MNIKTFTEVMATKKQFRKFRFFLYRSSLVIAPMQICSSFAVSAFYEVCCSCTFCIWSKGNILHTCIIK